MSSWQILSDDENNFRWEISEVKPNAASNATHFHTPNSSSPLISMADLLLQGCSILEENHNEGVKDTPMFRTGLGKSVAVSQSSIAKALSILGEDAYAGAGEEHAIDNGYSFSNSLFKTGSGKMVNISSNDLVRAKTLLGFKEDTVDCNFQSLQQTTKLHAIGETYEMQHSPHLHLNKVVNSYRMMNVVSRPSPSLIYNTSSVGGTRTLKNDSEINLVQPEPFGSSGRESSIKFYTAGGRSISVSNDALQRARSLLGDPDPGSFLNEGDVGNSIFSFLTKTQSDSTASGEGNDRHTPLCHYITAKSKHMTKSFTSPLKSSCQMEYSTKFRSVSAGSNLITKFNAVGKEIGCSLKSSITSQQKPLNDKNQMSDTVVYNSSLNDFFSRMDPLRRSSRRTFDDISNTIDTAHADNRQLASGKRRLGSRVTVSPFKKPRSSKFSAPLNQDVALFPNGFSKLSSNNFGCKRKVSTRFPFQNPRVHIREFFGMPLSEQKMLEHFPNQARQVTPGNAEKYMFHDDSGLNGMGSEAFFHLLVQHGASTSYASKEWVTNHYKWIVWKLACYERCFPARSAGKFFTMSNVLEELKYRYEREVNHGHRSAIKKILEGDAYSSSMMILCISTIHPDQGLETETPCETRSEPKSSEAVKVELTDGWYSVTAILDVPLSKQLAAGRLFVGQKLRIWGAGLCGWIGPVSPLEVSTSVSLQLNINGTYRVHWGEQLGLCKHAGPPLAFRCIKGNGGLIPQTLAGITRIYPILYKERLSNGGSVVRSERMETDMMQLYNQRRTAVVEGIISKFEKGRKESHDYDDGSEGAKIYKMLETAAEPEFLMADMSPGQLSSFVAYKAKLEATRQSNMEKSIENALKDAGLSTREVTQFMRVRMVGLTHKSRNDVPKEGLVTIWNPTEKQRQELVEGQAYVITGLIPSGSDSGILHLQARGPSTKWLPLSCSASEQFKPFFSCRKSISLSSLSEIPLSNEFDTAAYVVHVGEVYTSGHQKKQWVFVTDGSKSSLQCGQSISSLLAICFCSRSMDYDLIPPINYNLAGSTVGFCNLIKKEKDHINHIWVAEATENSTYYLTFDSPHCSHLRNAASCIRRWANISSLTIDKVKEKVLYIVGDCKE